MTVSFPYTECCPLSLEECELIGWFCRTVVEISGHTEITVHHKKEADRIMMLYLWTMICRQNHVASSSSYRSSPDRTITVFVVQDACRRWIQDMWNQDGSRRVPRYVLNGNEAQREAFMRGIGKERFHASPTLLQGLFFMSGGDPLYLSWWDGHDVADGVDYYDLMTASGTFHCGLGNGVVHNSPRRGATFVTRKITLGLNKILRGESDRLVLGNLDARRDWGHARDYCEGMWKILQHDRPDDYVLATNEMHSVREFVEKSFALRGIEIAWKGEGVDEVGYDAKTGQELIFVHPKYFRPAEVDMLIGDASKAGRELDWRPTIGFEELVREMVDHDCP